MQLQYHATLNTTWIRACRCKFFWVFLDLSQPTEITFISSTAYCFQNLNCPNLDCLVRSYKNVDEELVLPPMELEHVLTGVYTDIPRWVAIYTSMMYDMQSKTWIRIMVTGHLFYHNMKTICMKSNIRWEQLMDGNGLCSDECLHTANQIILSRHVFVSNNNWPIFYSFSTAF